MATAILLTLVVFTRRVRDDLVAIRGVVEWHNPQEAIEFLHGLNGLKARSDVRNDEELAERRNRQGM